MTLTKQTPHHFSCILAATLGVSTIATALSSSVAAAAAPAPADTSAAQAGTARQQPQPEAPTDQPTATGSRQEPPTASPSGGSSGTPTAPAGSFQPSTPLPAGAVVSFPVDI